MIRGSVLHQRMSGPKMFLGENQFLIFFAPMIVILMSWQAISWPESFFTEVAGDWNSFQMIWLNVFFHIISV